jgi:alanyl-tRNA synthetase
MATELLYHQSPAPLAFEATVVAHGTLGDRPAVVLDRTGFYPEAGGQLADRGTIAGLPVLDVQVDDARRVLHAVGGEPPAVGTPVRGEVDRARRKFFAAQHTGQHMFSRALIEVAGAETVSSRLGESGCTVDVDVSALPDGAVNRAVDLVNALIDDDLPVRAFFPEPGELERLPLRRKPKVSENVRVIAVGEFDYSPCGGTHCTSTSQVGLVRATGSERYKGKVRVSFAAGRRAREDLLAESAALYKLSGEFSCGALDVPAAVDKLRREFARSREAGRRAGEALAERVGAELLAASDGGPAVAVLDGGDRDFLRAVATRVTQDPRGVALLATEDDEGVHVIAARGRDSAFDCGAAVKRAAAAAGGKGGGRPDRAEGRLPRGVDWRALVAAG